MRLILTLIALLALLAGNLLVFQRDGEIVRMVTLGQLAAIGDGDYKADVVLSANGDAITMIGPDGRPVGR